MKQQYMPIILRRAAFALALVAVVGWMVTDPSGLRASDPKGLSAAPQAAPAARYAHTLVNIGGVLYLFGGQAGSTVFNDLWTFSNNTWSQITAANTPARVDHSAAVFNGKMYIFGGKDQTFTRKSDIWIYDPSANTWTQQTPSGGPGVRS